MSRAACFIQNLCLDDYKHGNPIPLGGGNNTKVYTEFMMREGGGGGGGHHFGTYFIIITPSFWHLFIFMDWDSGFNYAPRNSVRAQDQKRDKEKTYGW